MQSFVNKTCDRILSSLQRAQPEDINMFCHHIMAALTRIEKVQRRIGTHTNTIINNNNVSTRWYQKVMSDLAMIKPYNRFVLKTDSQGEYILNDGMFIIYDTERNKNIHIMMGDDINTKIFLYKCR